MEAAADDPLDSIESASEVRDYKSDCIALGTRILILDRHRVSPMPSVRPRSPWKSCTTTWTNAYLTKSSLKTYQRATTWVKKERRAYSHVCVTRCKSSSHVPCHLTQKPSRAFLCSASSAVRALLFADATDDVPVIGARPSQQTMPRGDSSIHPSSLKRCYRISRLATWFAQRV